ncbi:LamG domain-containing protein, partial [Actinomadura soli]
WGEKWTSALTPAKTTGSRFEQPLPPTIPQGTKIGWGVRAWDGEQYSAWSYNGAQTGCYFFYDPAEPEKPTITSTDYPADDVWHGGVGQPGIFTISDAAGVADRYIITLNEEPPRTVHTAAGAPRQVEVAPNRSGPNILTVQALAPSSQVGSSDSYEFRVNVGSEPVARFTLDEATGTTAVTATGPGRPAWLHGSAVLGGEGKNGTALSLDGTSGAAESSLPIVDTTESFTVSAWAKPTAHRQGELVAQSGTYQSGFVLGMHANGAAIFEWPTVDNNTAGTPWQWAVDDAPLPLGQWSHLIGVYDKSAAQMRLYVNGELQATGNGVTPLKTHGPLQIGRSLYNGFFVNNWPGSIDDVQVFAQPLSAEQAQGLAGGATPPGTDLVAHWSMDEPQGEPRVYSTAAPWKATVRGAATLGAAGQAGTAMRLDDMTQAHAGTDRPLVNTTRSFAVSAWVRLEKGDRTRTVLSQDGTSRSGFYLKYDAAYQKWAFSKVKVDTGDDTTAYQAFSKEPAVLNSWTHLVGVYNRNTGKMQIYVNGDPGTESPQVSSLWSADGGFQIGRSKWAGMQADHWPGLVDDVRVYDRILGDREAEELVTQHPVLKGRWSLNESGGADPFPVGAPGVVLHNGAAIDPSFGFKGASAGGLWLGATSNAFAETAAPPVWTDESFTVAGWVRNMGRPQQAATVFSQPGVNTNAFVLRYVPGPDPVEQGGWQIAMQNSDNSGSVPLVASHSYFSLGDWMHLAVVYDALRDRVSLYVNGQLDETADGVSQESQVVPFRAAGNGGLQVGRNKVGTAGGSEFWPDAIDDVWAYQGALTQPQIARLASEPEIPTQTSP